MYAQRIQRSQKEIIGPSVAAHQPPYCSMYAQRGSAVAMVTRELHWYPNFIWANKHHTSMKPQSSFLRLCTALAICFLLLFLYKSLCLKTCRWQHIQGSNKKTHRVNLSGNLNINDLTWSIQVAPTVKLTFSTEVIKVLLLFFSDKLGVLVFGNNVFYE